MLPRSLKKIIHLIMKIEVHLKNKNMDVSKNGGTQQPWVFLLKMIILGCFGGSPIFGNTHIHSQGTFSVDDFSLFPRREKVTRLLEPLRKCLQDSCLVVMAHFRSFPSSRKLAAIC